MEQLRKLTPDEIYLADVIFPHIKKFDFDESHHGVILEWREDTPNEVKRRARHYKNITVKAK